MNNPNSVMLEGNLVRDPELSYTPRGVPLCNFSIAVNRRFKQDDEVREEVSYFDVATWARQAEMCVEYLNKGRGVRVVGRLKQERWKSQAGDPLRRRVLWVGRGRGRKDVRPFSICWDRRAARSWRRWPWT